MGGKSCWISTKADAPRKPGNQHKYGEHVGRVAGVPSRPQWESSREHEREPSRANDQHHLEIQKGDTSLLLGVTYLVRPTIFFGNTL